MPQLVNAALDNLRATAVKRLESEDEAGAGDAETRIVEILATRRPGHPQRLIGHFHRARQKGAKAELQLRRPGPTREAALALIPCIRLSHDLI